MESAGMTLGPISERRRAGGSCAGRWPARSNARLERTDNLGKINFGGPSCFERLP